MITKQNLMDLSREFSLPVNTVEKDYVLGWLLAGISNDNELSNKWIFKGGTCLKKCYFETYRFSEDLDYTLIDSSHINESFLVDRFKAIGKWIYETAGIEILEETIRFEIYRNSDGKTTVEGRLNYVGPLKRRNNPYRIKFDLTAEEILVMPPVLRDVHHPYSDKPANGIKAHCYDFSEVFAEKIRALSERARPRDLYDVIHLYRHAFFGEKPNKILKILKKKCEYKTIPVPTIELLQAHPKLNELDSEWSNMLAHQVPMLPAKDQFWNDLSDMFEWLHGNNTKLIKKPIPIPSSEKIDLSWRPPSMIQAWESAVPLELIRYAAANHLCVNVLFDENNKLVEPYDLKRTKDGQLILIAMMHESEEFIVYRMDEIQKIELSQVSFIPRYLISLTPFVKWS